MVDQPRTVHVEHCMGTVFSVDVRDAGNWAAAIGEVVDGLHQVDAVFSTYQPDSDISRIRNHELAVADAHPLVTEVLQRCEQLQDSTDGYFSARWNGQLDPTGLVKGWAIERASELLRARGSRNHSVNGGGDIQLAGESAPGRPWRVGISNPLDPSVLLTVVSGRDLAVATSGIAERGLHIVDPHTRNPADALASVTVVGRWLGEVDAFATAAFAMGPQALPWLETQSGYEACTVTADGAFQATEGFGPAAGMPR
jgi:thiamine biosynthesis lipoprotein